MQRNKKKNTTKRIFTFSYEDLAFFRGSMAAHYYLTADNTIKNSNTEYQKIGNTWLY